VNVKSTFLQLDDIYHLRRADQAFERDHSPGAVNPPS
jgi:hypothetical protein